MLVLTRRVGEQVIVPAIELSLTVLSVEGKAVRLGIDAPEQVTILRNEVLSRLREASAASPSKG